MKETISSLIAAAERGDQASSAALFPALYAELHRMAKRELRRLAPGATLGATSVLHEAYLDISRREHLDFPDRARFMAYGARVMRGLIIDYVRRRQAQKRGAGFEITSLTGDAVERQTDHAELSRLSDALDELAAAEPSLAQIVDLKFFCGLTLAEIAALRGTSERTVQRDWQKARLLLQRSLQNS